MINATSVLLTVVLLYVGIEIINRLMSRTDLSLRKKIVVRSVSGFCMGLVVAYAWGLRAWLGMFSVGIVTSLVSIQAYWFSVRQQERE